MGGGEGERGGRGRERERGRGGEGEGGEREESMRWDDIILYCTSWPSSLDFSSL